MTGEEARDLARGMHVMACRVNRDVAEFRRFGGEAPAHLVWKRIVMLDNGVAITWWSDRSELMVVHFDS